MSVTLYAPNGQPARAFQDAPNPTRRNRVGLTRPVETSIVAGFNTVLGLLPDPDEIVTHEGRDIYDKMRADDAVWAAEFQLMTRMLGRPWDVHPPEHLKSEPFAAEVADYVQTVFAGMGIDQMLSHLYRALRHGHAGGQLVYRREDVTHVPAYFLPERRELFRFGKYGKLFIAIDGIPEEAEPYRWAWHVNEPEPDRPSGRSILQRVYYPWKFKRTGWDLWVTAMDRFAVPSLAALFEMADFDADKATEIATHIAEQLQLVASGSVGALANVSDLKQVGGSTAVQGFDPFVEMCDRSIYRGLLTTTLTVSEGKQGAERGDTSVADDSADQVAYWYASQLSGSMTAQIVNYTALLRYGEAARQVMPHFSFDFDEPISFDRVMKLMENSFPVSKRAIYARFATGLEPGDDTDAFVRPVRNQDREASTPGVTTNGTATARIEFPAEDEEEVRSRLFTYFRNKEIQSRFKRLRDEGATWDEALDVLEESEFALSRGSYRNIVAKG